MRNIAVNRKNLSAATIARMKKAPVLLCYQRKLIEQKGIKSDDVEEEEWEVGYDLKIAEQIVIADDTNAHQVFGADLFTAPQEDIVEGTSSLLDYCTPKKLIQPKYFIWNWALVGLALWSKKNISWELFSPIPGAQLVHVLLFLNACPSSYMSTITQG